MSHYQLFRQSGGSVRQYPHARIVQPYGQSHQAKRKPLYGNFYDVQKEENNQSLYFSPLTLRNLNNQDFFKNPNRTPGMLNLSFTQQSRQLPSNIQNLHNSLLHQNQIKHHKKQRKQEKQCRAGSEKYKNMEYQDLSKNKENIKWVNNYLVEKPTQTHTIFNKISVAKNKKLQKHIQINEPKTQKIKSILKKSQFNQIKIQDSIEEESEANEQSSLKPNIHQKNQQQHSNSNNNNSSDIHYKEQIKMLTQQVHYYKKLSENLTETVNTLKNLKSKQKLEKQQQSSSSLPLQSTQKSPQKMEPKSQLLKLQNTQLHADITLLKGEYLRIKAINNQHDQLCTTILKQFNIDNMKNLIPFISRLIKENNTASKFIESIRDMKNKVSERNYRNEQALTQNLQELWRWLKKVIQDKLTVDFQASKLKRGTKKN